MYLYISSRASVLLSVDMMFKPRTNTVKKKISLMLYEYCCRISWLEISKTFRVVNWTSAAFLPQGRNPCFTSRTYFSHHPTGMEYLASLQEGIDDHKPSLFGKRAHVYNGCNLTQGRGPCGATALSAHSALVALPTGAAHSSPSTVSPASAQFL